MTENDSGSVRRARPWRRFLPLILLALGLIAFFAFGLHNYLSFDKLHQHRETLVQFIEA